MDEQLNNFIPLSIVRSDEHMNVSKYITKFKRDAQGTANYDCSNSLSDMTASEELHEEVTYPNHKKIRCIAKLTIQHFYKK